MQSVFKWGMHNFGMNMRFVVVGIGLGIILTLAVYIGSPVFLGFDTLR